MAFSKVIEVDNKFRIQQLKILSYLKDTLAVHGLISQQLINSGMLVYKLWKGGGGEGDFWVGLFSEFSPKK